MLATVDRAQIAMAEIEAHRAADAAERDRTANIPADEDDRRDELITWAVDEHADGTPLLVNEEGNDAVLER